VYGVCGGVRVVCVMCVGVWGVWCGVSVCVGVWGVSVCDVWLCV
jgi:hypothetical protein